MFINLTVCHQNDLKIAIGNCNISKCGRLSQPSWLLDVLFKLIYLLKSKQSEHSKTSAENWTEYG